jgi:hypothetical protein
LISARPKLVKVANGPGFGDETPWRAITMRSARSSITYQNKILVLQLLAATVNAIGALVVGYFWAEDQLNMYCEQVGDRLKTMHDYMVYDDASIGMAFYVAFLTGTSGFVLMAGLGFSRRGWAKTVLWFVSPCVLWLHVLLWFFVTLSYEYIP